MSFIHPLDRALSKYQRQATSKPQGTYSFEECAARWSFTAEQTKKVLSEMKTAKLVVEVPGKKLNANKSVVPCTYYRFPTE